MDLSHPVEPGHERHGVDRDGTARVSDSDYTPLAGQVVNFAAGQTTATFSVSPTADDKVEADETFTVGLGSVSGGYGQVTASAASRTGTITNDDSAVFTVRADASGAEDGGPITFTVDLSHPVDQATSVTVSTADGTALASDSDYTPLAGHVVTFAAGQTTATFSVSPTADDKVEADETFTVGLGNVSGGYGQVTASAASRTGTITNDDTAVFTVRADANGTEDGGPITFTVDLSHPVDQATSVTVSTADGTALVSDSDYTPLSRPCGDLRGRADDGHVQREPDGGRQGGGGRDVHGGPGQCSGGYGQVTASAASRTGTISNDDSAVFTIRADASGAENGGPITFTVDLSNPVDQATSVTVSTADGTATE